jgi:hypothetical protein
MSTLVPQKALDASQSYVFGGLLELRIAANTQETCRLQVLYASFRVFCGGVSTSQF